ncbi:MAG: hypothetical protein QY307_07700 [Acidimicrobiia bacterium]|nr:MAG: hypothetical protein QY307_07700 [Acidimicrobiia bacterium]
MATASRLVSETPVSPSLVENIHRLQQIYTCWFPTLRPVEIVAEHLPPAADRPESTFALFSGGVDSFHTAITEAPRLTGLLYIRAMDMLEQDQALIDSVIGHLSSAAAELSLPLALADTNVRQFSEPWADWATQYHLMAPAAVAHVASDGITLLLATADRSYRNLYPWGGHPLTSPLFGSDRVAIEPIGWGSRRIDRATALGDHQVALDHLRVCWRNPNGEFNCNRCEKCIRTRIALALVGALDRCPTLQSPIGVDEVLRTELNEVTVDHWRDALAFAAERSIEHELIPAMRRCVDAYESSSAKSRLTVDLNGLLEAEDGHEFLLPNRERIFDTMWAHHARWLTGQTLRRLPGRLGARFRRRRR